LISLENQWEDTDSELSEYVGKLRSIKQA